MDKGSREPPLNKGPPWKTFCLFPFKVPSFGGGGVFLCFFPLSKTGQRHLNHLASPKDFLHPIQPSLDGWNHTNTCPDSQTNRQGGRQTVRQDLQAEQTDRQTDKAHAPMHTCSHAHQTQSPSLFPEKNPTREKQDKPKAQLQPQGHPYHSQVHSIFFLVPAKVQWLAPCTLSSAAPPPYFGYMAVMSYGLAARVLPASPFHQESASLFFVVAARQEHSDHPPPFFSRKPPSQIMHLPRYFI